MRIRLTLYLSDADYAANLENHFKKYFSDKLELYICSNEDSLKNVVKTGKTDILILDEGTSGVAEEIGSEVLAAVLVAESA